MIKESKIKKVTTITLHCEECEVEISNCEVKDGN